MPSALGTAIRIASRVALLGVALAFPIGQASAQDSPSALERRVKAAFLYKFAGYVEWPAGSFQRADEPVTIGVAGDDQLAGEVAQLVAGRSVDGRPLSVRRVTFPEPAGGVQILFIARSEAGRMGQLIRALPSRPMLIVSESDGALDQGSIINLLILDGRVRFEISLDAAEKRGVRLSSRLLALAQRVQTGATQ